MNLQMIVVALVLTCAALSGCSAPTSPGFEAARQRVLDELVRPDSVDHPVIVFGLNEALQPGDEIRPYHKEGYQPVPVATAIEGETWFFWIDDAPGALFVHPNRFAFVPASGGDITVQDEEWWPELNGAGLWIDEDEYWDPDNWVWANIEAPQAREGGPAAGRARAALVQRPAAQEGGQQVALVINGYEPGETAANTMVQDANAVDDILTDSGFQVTHLGPAGGTNPQQDGTADLGTWTPWFTEQGNNLQPGDTLFVFVVGHGFEGATGNGFAGPTSERDLIAQLGKINPGVHIVVIIQACQSGSFADGLMNVADATIMTTSNLDSSYTDVDRDVDPNPEDTGSEYVSGFVEDWREVMAEPGQQDAARQRAADQNSGFFVEVSALSHVSATEKDASYLSGMAFPRLVRGAPQTRPTSVALEDPIGDGLNCRSGQPLAGPTPPEVDISRALAEVLFDQATGEANQVQFTIEVGEVSGTIRGPVYGGVEFLDASGARSDPDPTWIFNGIGNKNFSFAYGRETFLPELHEFHAGSGWGPNPNTGFSGQVQGNQIIIWVPVSEIPPDSSFYFSITDLTACDAAGLTEDFEASAMLPALGP